MNKRAILTNIGNLDFPIVWPVLEALNKGLDTITVEMNLDLVSKHVQVKFKDRACEPNVF